MAAQPGSKHHDTSLRETDVMEIRHMYQTGQYSQRTLADMYGISQKAVSKLIRRVTWTHI